MFNIFLLIATGYFVTMIFFIGYNLGQMKALRQIHREIDSIWGKYD